MNDPNKTNFWLHLAISSILACAVAFLFFFQSARHEQPPLDGLNTRRTIEEMKRIFEERMLSQQRSFQASSEETNRLIEATNKFVKDALAKRQADLILTQEEAAKAEEERVNRLAEALAHKIQPVAPLPKTPEEAEKIQSETVQKLARAIAESYRQLVIEDARQQVQQQQQQQQLQQQQLQQQLQHRPTDGQTESATDFPWPPPKPSTFVKIDKTYGLSVGEYGAAADRLERVLSGLGYSEKAYYPIGDTGFVLVCRLEQFASTGAPMPPPDRWSDAVPAFRKFSFVEYIRRLFSAQPGHYRVIAFAVTSESFGFSKVELTSDEAKKLLAGGHATLPEKLVAKVATKDTQAYALIYEFEKKTAGDQAHYLSSGSVAALDHLGHTGILDALLATKPK